MAGQQRFHCGPLLAGWAVSPESPVWRQNWHAATTCLKNCEIMPHFFPAGSRLQHTSNIIHGYKECMSQQAKWLGWLSWRTAMRKSGSRGVVGLNHRL
eukprot:scaffold73042_cov26-Prasinocladus_malaysianus.AAC.1